MQHIRNIGFIMWACWIPLSPVFADYTGVSSTLNGCGGWASNGLFSTLMTVVSSCPAEPASTGGNFTGFSGFLETYVAAPSTDSNHNGIPDENDPDNDVDGLQDSQELAGSAFNPSTPTDLNQCDSDTDGASDLDEAHAGTNPLDANSLFEFGLLRVTGSHVILRWKSRMGSQYEVRTADSLAELITARALATVNGAAGPAPWYESETTFTNNLSPGRSFYSVKRVQP